MRSELFRRKKKRGSRSNHRRNNDRSHRHPPGPGRWIPITTGAVVTFVCPPEDAVEACFRGIKKASEVIDMQTHKGEHPRMGATDVCPFIPISDFTEAEAIELAHQLGKRVGEELSIPIFLYESAATRPERENLAVVRKGEYEGLIEAIEKDPDRKPDYGPAKMNLKAGADRDRGPVSRWWHTTFISIPTGFRPPARSPTRSVFCGEDTASSKPWAL